MSYRVIFLKQVIAGDWSSGPGDIWLKHETVLPFPPMENCSYSDGKWSTENAAWEEKKNNQPAAEICWDNDKQIFTFYTAVDRSCWYQDDLRAIPPSVERNKAYVEYAKKRVQAWIDDYGWELRDV